MRFEREPVPDEHLEGLDSREINDSLHRLLSHGLVYGRPKAGMAYTTWARLRITAQGLRVLGEWPDLDLVASAAALHHILRHLGKEAPEENKGPLVRAAGVVGRTADEIVRGTASDIARTVGREVAGERPPGKDAIFRFCMCSRKARTRTPGRATSRYAPGEAAPSGSTSPTTRSTTRF